MHIIIPAKDVAGVLGQDLEGRLEVMDDVGLKDSPDYADMDAVAGLLRAAKVFPATLELSDAETQQAAIAVQNCRDFADEIPETMTALDALAATLKAAGYPR
jgi:hypothetical protein